MDRDDSRNRNSYYYNHSRANGPREERGVHSTQNYFQPRVSSSQIRSSRWDALDSEPYTSRYSYGRRVSHRNALGFHGEFNPSRMLERELFEISEHVTEGINFDNVAFDSMADS